MAVAKKTTKAAPSTKPVATVKPVKEALTKTALVNHIAEQADVEAKSVKAVLTALESAILGALNKKGVGAFTLPGLLKLDVVKAPAKPKRKGIDPFTEQERVFAAKPASVKIKTRAL